MNEYRSPEGWSGDEVYARLVRREVQIREICAALGACPTIAAVFGRPMGPDEAVEQVLKRVSFLKVRDKSASALTTALMEVQTTARADTPGAYQTERDSMAEQLDRIDTIATDALVSQAERDRAVG